MSCKNRKQDFTGEIYLTNGIFQKAVHGLMNWIKINWKSSPLLNEGNSSGK